MVVIGGLAARHCDDEDLACLSGVVGDAVLGEFGADDGEVFCGVDGDGLHWIGLRWWLVVNCLTERSIDYAQQQVHYFLGKIRENSKARQGKHLARQRRGHSTVTVYI